MQHFNYTLYDAIYRPSAGFDIEHPHEFSSQSGQIIKELTELFHDVSGSIAGITKRFRDFCYNDENKQDMHLLNENYNQVYAVLEALTSGHKKLILQQEDIFGCDLLSEYFHERDIMTDRSYLSSFMTNPDKSNQDISNTLSSYNLYMQKKCSSIKSRLEELSFVWKGENFERFYEVVDLLTDTISDMQLDLSAKIVNHIKENETTTQKV